MAKQTFTTGQVLTAAQMTSLQQTAMGGGSATAKTASYTLVAADAGATVIMNSASATTITVNTSLFSAGDTVFIQNIGAGVCTITPGTATVNTASSLALAQYASGYLYFTAAGASIFSKADGAAAGGAYTSIATGSLSGTSVTISPISGSYKHLYLVVVDPIASSGRIGLRINADTGSNYQYWRADLDSATPTATSPAAVINVGGDLTSAVDWTYTFFIENYSIADLYKPITVHHRKNATSNSTSGWAHHNSATAITSLTMVNTDAASYTSGTYTLYGVN